uniref:Ig-like domain-containing protein n=1 Tax=Amazona collaria TaxID=241587 RepID=A0A8B9EYQ5_9PSIT
MRTNLHWSWWGVVGYLLNICTLFLSLGLVLFSLREGCDTNFLFSEPEVVFTNKEKVQKEVKAALSENVTLSCEVAQEKADVKWYKEGKLITSSKKFKVESEGKCRRLVVGQLEKKDAGEYTCEAAGQKLTFKIDVTGETSFI